MSAVQLLTSTVTQTSMEICFQINSNKTKLSNTPLRSSYSWETRTLNWYQFEGSMCNSILKLMETKGMKLCASEMSVGAEVAVRVKNSNEKLRRRQWSLMDRLLIPSGFTYTVLDCKCQSILNTNVNMHMQLLRGCQRRNQWMSPYSRHAAHSAIQYYQVSYKVIIKILPSES